MAERATKQSFSLLLTAGTKLTVATIVAGLLGYVFQVLMARLLADTAFATFSSFNSMTMVCASPLAAAVMLITRRVAILDSAGQKLCISNLYRFWQICTSIIFSLIGVLFAFNISTVQTFFKTFDPLAIWLFLGIISLNALASINAAFIQGMQRFGWLGGLSIAIVFLKIPISCSLILAADWQLQGALAGMLMAAAITWALGARYIYKGLPYSKTSFDQVHFRIPWKDSLSVLAATLGMTVISQIDVPLANLYFSPERAASYAAAAVLGKAVLYLPGGLILALFPVIAGPLGNCPKDRQSILRHSLITTTIACSIAAAIYGIWGNQIIEIIYGNRYHDAGQILTWYGWLMVPVSLLLILQTYSIALENNAACWLLAGTGFVPVCAFVMSPPQTPTDLLSIIGLVACGSFIVGYAIISEPPPIDAAQ
jgi:O-antigen/teichoic acid export membrane protein